MKRLDFDKRDYSYPIPKEPKKKVFTSTKMADIFYEVQDEYWLDDDTYVIIFQDMVDADSDTYHLEVEYHKDEKRITYTRVYEYENVHDMLPSHVFKKQIDEYILQQVGVIGKNDTIVSATIEVKFEVVLPFESQVNDYESFLEMAESELTEYAKTLYYGKIKALK